MILNNSNKKTKTKLYYLINVSLLIFNFKKGKQIKLLIPITNTECDDGDLWLPHHVLIKCWTIFFYILHSGIGLS